MRSTKWLKLGKKDILGLIATLAMVGGMFSSALADEVGGLSSGQPGEFKIALKTEQFSHQVKSDHINSPTNPDYNNTRIIHLKDTKETVNRIFIEGSYNIDKRWSTEIKLGSATTALEWNGTITPWLSGTDNYNSVGRLESNAGLYYGFGCKGLIQQGLALDIQIAQQKVKGLGMIYEESSASYLRLTEAETTSCQVALILNEDIGKLNLYGGPRIYYSRTVYETLFGRYPWNTRQGKFATTSGGFRDYFGLFAGTNWRWRKNVQLNLEFDIGNTVSGSCGIQLNF